MENLNLENSSVVSNMNMENTSMVSSMNLENTSMVTNTNMENNSILSPNPSFAGSVGSISFTEQNNTDIGTDLDLNSDISMQSNLDDLNNSINFSEDEHSVAKSDHNDTNAVNPDPPVSAPMGMFASQNKRFFNFQGFFPK
ncbi:uncharacterized protein LOC117179088 [Belonocnema kinseyi]|uniref:uncharacterized protein LOC117179088 n=1 Tax=Belonocnema kinseyi TaxID=2817044 RepID=UPI00143E0E60|nr:uncharacterized protein LOC117179088 [Belonocnema kinseyi]